MITRDFLLRELERFVQVLAVVLFHKGKRDPHAAQDALAEGFQTVSGTPLDALHAMDCDGVLELAAYEGTFSAERAVALADLLAEDEHALGRERAAWLYRAAFEAGGPVPFDVAERIAALPDGIE
ncbi:MAG: hypothetical protein HKN04_12780 [Rhodothermaceae bacterium]|nr:hypothetical protein [Rhodothermaceae bacterium]